MGLTRRDFLKSVISVPFLPYFNFNSIPSNPVVSSYWKEALSPQESIESARRVFFPIPSNPVVVMFNPNIKSYPSHWNINSYFSGPIYNMVWKVLTKLDFKIHPSEKIVIKPNWCTERRFPMPITHPSILVPIIEWVKAKGGRNITIAEGPMTLTRADRFFWGRGFTDVEEICKRMNVKFQDVNDDEFYWVIKGNSYLSEFKREDLMASGMIPLKDNMYFLARDSNNIEAQNYHVGTYAISKTVMDCDVFINVPKLKTHLWTGITCALKNLIGITLRSTEHYPDQRVGNNKYKEYHREAGMRDIPHFDKKYGQKSYDNDVLWRTIADLNKIILSKKYLCIVDGIIGTDRDGPISTSIVRSGVIVGGTDPVKVDSACCKIMGWDARKIKLIKECERVGLGNYFDIRKDLIGDKRAFNYKYFIPPSTYRGRV